MDFEKLGRGKPVPYYYLLPNTHYLVLIPYFSYLLPIHYYQLLNTSPLLPTPPPACYLIPIT